MDLIARQGKSASKEVEDPAEAKMLVMPARPREAGSDSRRSDPAIKSWYGRSSNWSYVEDLKAKPAESKSVDTSPSLLIFLINIPAKPVRGHYPIICHVKRKGTNRKNGLSGLRRRVE